MLNQRQEMPELRIDRPATLPSHTGVVREDLVGGARWGFSPLFLEGMGRKAFVVTRIKPQT